ncbi:MAG: tight adherence protein [Frankiaceae bacterium]|jgi:tight adherence protein B|nr:tight adherence protein [Frankiaceae bacterium]
MGAFVGLLLGAGLLLIWRSGPRAPQRKPTATRTWRQRLQEQLTQAGIEGVTPAQLITVSIVLFVLAFLAMAVVSRTWSIALAFALFAGYGPLGLVRYRRRQRGVELRELWPEVVDNLASGVRAGLSLPEALTQVGVRGPEALRRPFQRFGEDYRATGRFAECLDRLKEGLADPVGDRIVESLRMAREVGGTDLGRLLRTLSAFLREDARTRAELETRQGWSVNAARMALVAPWALLGLLSLRPEAVAAYNTATGALVLAFGGGISLIAYRVMIRIGRLPEEQRVLR